jgi:hypothetical protein
MEVEIMNNNRTHKGMFMFPLARSVGWLGLLAIAFGLLCPPLIRESAGQRKATQRTRKKDQKTTPEVLKNGKGQVNPGEVKGKVTKVTLNERTGLIKCPETLHIDGTITTNGPAVVKYKWYSTGEHWPTRTLTFSTADSKSVSLTWLVKKNTGNLYLQTLSPNKVEANNSVFFLCHLGV